MTIEKSLSTRFIYRILIILFVGQSLIWAWSFYREKTTLEDSLNNVLSLSGGIISNIAATALVSSDHTYLERIIDDILKNEDIISVEILDADGKRLIKKSHESTGTAYKISEFPIRSGTDVIGKVRIRYSVRRIKANLAGHLITSMMLQMVVFIGLIFLIALFFKRDIGGRIREMSRVIEKITLGDLSQSIGIEDKTEIGTIARGIDFLITRLKGYIRKLKDISRNVSAAMSQLNLTFKNVTNSVNNQQKSLEDVSLSLRNASKSQLRIHKNTDTLLSLSNDNVSALLEFKATSEEIAAAAESLQRNINDSYSTTTELTQSSHEVASLTTEVSAAMQEASASADEINATVKEIERISRESAELSFLTTETVSGKGMLSIVEAVERMEQIEASVTELKQSIERLGGMSKDIEKILSVIRDITEQTGLLSLNAQILAVQAGEYGKSFSIVASEMKTLSDRTASSTREIAGIVSTLKREIQTVVNGTNETFTMVEKGSEAVMNTGEALREILHSSQRSSEIAQSIKRASIEQTRGLELIVKAIEHIKKMIFKVSRATEEQEKGISYLLESVSSIKESMEITKKATDEQAKSTKFITDNIELANEKTAEITTASSEQQKINEHITSLLQSVMNLGKNTARDVKEVSLFISSLHAEVEELRKEMDHFRTETGQ